MAQIYEYQDIDAHVILLFVHPAVKYNTVEWENGADFAPEYLLELPEA